ncbi:GntP family permease [Thioalkalivibrio sulfidiphilus]|uniref:GntP family permease n=1 Tax=Thioalkalivibrio sulfidiphilus TaxID=1033854 RepID=UPI00037C92A9|nr:GntP family permease [Thioalkalivibrio sulfidiphilus]
MLGIVVILVTLGLLIYLAYRGISLLILAPALATFAVVASLEGRVLASYTQIFMGSTADFIALYFPVFLLGAVFGKLMEDSGSAEVLANAIIERLGSSRAILAVVLSCAVMTYGGVSLFVVAFAVYPIAAALFRQADIPKRLIPATIALGAFTFTMTALPGTPAIQNAIPMPYFGTSPFAAPGLGVITAAVMFTLGMLWLQYRARRLAAEGYGDHADADFTPDKELRERAAGEGFDLMELPVDKRPVGPPPVLIAVLPLVLVIGINLVFTFLVIPRMDTDYLALPIYGETSIEQVRGIWSVIAALVLSLLVLIATNWRRLGGLKQSIDNGANASLLPIFNTASLVGFGAVIASLGAFLLIRDAVVGIGGDNPLISLAIAVNVLAGMTGSASGGMSIALSTLGDTYLEMARVHGINPELMHRVTAVATGGLDTLPHNGAVITLLAITRLTHRQAYFDLAMTAMLVPFISLVVLITLGTLFGSF